MILGCVSAIWRKEVGLSYCEKNNFDGDVLFNVCPLTRRDVRAFLPQMQRLVAFLAWLSQMHFFTVVNDFSVRRQLLPE